MRSYQVTMRIATFRVIITFIFLLALSFCETIHGDILTEARARQFADCYIKNSPDLRNFVLKEELLRSERLNIKYQGIDNKFMISTELSPVAIEALSRSSSKYTLSIEQLEGNYSLLSIIFPSIKLTRQFYFLDGYMVSPPYYHSRKWENIKSKYFIFIKSQGTELNQYCIDRMDAFVDSIASVIGLNTTDRSMLEEQKIYYYLCSGEKEIKQLTGFTTNGMYYIPYDYVVSVIGNHYHELVHLLVNFRLHNPALFTNPYFQEGIASALGGRAGKAPGVILENGASLSASGFASYNEILSREGFNTSDPSISYPLAGIYNLFLMNQLGTEKYFSLYRQQSPDSDTALLKTFLPAPEQFNNFTFEYLKNRSINLSPEDKPGRLIIKSEEGEIFDNGREYVFHIRDTLVIGSDDNYNITASRKFQELAPGKKYKGGRYMIIAEESELSVYNLYSAELCAKYVSAFALDQKKPIQENGIFKFAVSKSVFDSLDLKLY